MVDNVPGQLDGREHTVEHQLSCARVRGRRAVYDLVAAEGDLTHQAGAGSRPVESVVAILQLLSSRVVVVVPALVNFLAYCENVCPCCSVEGSLKLQLSDEFSLIESSHEILDFVEDSNISSSECSTEMAWCGAVIPAVSKRAIPNTHCLCSIA